MDGCQLSFAIFDVVMEKQNKRTKANTVATEPIKMLGESIQMGPTQILFTLS